MSRLRLDITKLASLANCFLPCEGKKVTHSKKNFSHSKKRKKNEQSTILTMFFPFSCKTLNAMRLVVLMETNMIQKLEAAPANQDGMVTSVTKVSLKSILTLVPTLGVKIIPHSNNSSGPFFHVMVANLLKSMFANYCLELT